MIALTNHTIEHHRLRHGYGRATEVSVWTLAIDDEWRIISVPTTTMPYYRFTSERIVHAEDEQQANCIFYEECWQFATHAKCDSLKSDARVTPGYRHTKSHCDIPLFVVSSQEAQFVAEREFGRKLTEDELCTVGSKLDDYIDVYESIQDCINDRIE